MRPQFYFGWQSHTTEEVSPNALGEVRATPRAHVRATSEVIRCELRHFAEAVAGQTMRDEMMRAIDKEQCPFSRRQTLTPTALQLRHAAIARFHDVGRGDGPRALRALRLHATRRYPRCGADSQRRPSRLGVTGQTPLSETPAASTRALNREWGGYHGSLASG